MTTVKLSDLDNALFFVDSGYGNEAYISRETGQIFWISPDLDPAEEETPPTEELEDEEKYISIPDQRELDLGNQLVFDFTEAELPQCYDQVRAMFRKRGAYGRFSELLERHHKRDQWHRFRDERQRQALRDWCEDNDLSIED